MDGVSDQVNFAFRELRKEGPIEERWQMLLRIEATFTFTVRGVTILEDPHFNVVEFAAAAAKWLRHAASEFSYSTMDAEENDIVFFRRANSHWRAGSIWGIADGVTVELEELMHALQAFIGELEYACRRYLGVDIGPALEDRPGHFSRAH